MTMPVKSLQKPRELQTGPMLVWVSFEIAGQRYAVDIRRVREVLTTTQVERVPGSPTSVIGIINLRGRIVTVFNLHQRLGALTPSSSTQEHCVIVVEAEGEPVALNVDRITDLCSVAAAAINPPPKVASGGLHSVVQGVVNIRGELLTLLDIDEVMNID